MVEYLQLPPKPQTRYLVLSLSFISFWTQLPWQSKGPNGQHNMANQPREGIAQLCMECSLTSSLLCGFQCHITLVSKGEIWGLRSIQGKRHVEHLVPLVCSVQRRGLLVAYSFLMRGAAKHTLISSVATATREQGGIAWGSILHFLSPYTIHFWDMNIGHSKSKWSCIILSNLLFSLCHS